MEFDEYIEKYEAQKKIDKLARRYKNKRIVLYGAGQFANAIFQNCDLSKLNIIAISDRKFDEEENRNFYNLNCIPPKEIGNIDCDVILISNFDYGRFLTLLDDHLLYGTKNASIEVRPLIRLGFRDLFLRK